MCRSLEYNVTYLPNLFSHMTLDDAITGFQQKANSTLEANCSTYSLFFLCGVFFPECRADQVVYPCASVCQGECVRPLLSVPCLEGSRSQRARIVVTRTLSPSAEGLLLPERLTPSLPKNVPRRCNSESDLG